MPLELVDLDQETREQMLAELADDLARGSLYLSNRLTDRGRREYPDLLREAFASGDEVSLGRAFETAVRKGRPHSKRVPHDAAQTLAEGEFNRFYLRGLCRSVLAFGGTEVEVYRARYSGSPRSESEAMIGMRLDAAELLADLREHPGVDTALRLPPGPNSGLSARHPR